jgi:uncharacterized membrane protein
MTTSLQDVVTRLLHVDSSELTERERRVIDRFLQRKRVSRNTNQEFTESLTFGQRVADRVASFGGSWPFIGLFGLFLVAWVALNLVLLGMRHTTFDPYPFILLNLILSMLAAVQAPVIMMSQNRHAAKDRIDAAHDYEVNLRAELEIMALQQKIDVLREQQWNELLELQTHQIELLERLLSGEKNRSADGDSSGSLS